MRGAARAALRSVGHWIIQRAGQPSYVVIYDDVSMEGEDYGEQYYGYFGSPDEAWEMFASFAGDAPERYRNVKLCLAISDGAEAPTDAEGDPWTITGPWPTDALEAAASMRDGPPPVPRVRLPIEPPGLPIEADDARPFWPANLVITNADKCALGIEHLRKARDLFRDAGAKRTLDRVRLALSSAKGARRHARLEPYRLERQETAGVERKAGPTDLVPVGGDPDPWPGGDLVGSQPDRPRLPEGADTVVSYFREGSYDWEQAMTDLCLIGMSNSQATSALLATGEWLIEDAVWQGPDGERYRWKDDKLGRPFLYSAETCPSKHWNDGDDICADCGEDLQGSPDGKEG